MALDWQSIFASTVSPFELILRGSLIYLGIFIVLRVFLRRVAGNVTMADLLMMVLLADAAQNAMADAYDSITDGGILVGTIIFWNYALDRLGFHIPTIGRFVHPDPLLLVDNGRVLWRNMRREYITEAELLSQMRERGVEELADVKRAYIEGDGRISIIKRR